MMSRPLTCRAPAGVEYGRRPPHTESATLASSSELDRFLAGVERRAFVHARLATGNADDALDIVQDAMLALATRYAERPPAEWGPLFHTILQSRVRDWYRRSAVRRRFLAWLSPRTGDEDADPLAELPDPANPEPSAEVASARRLAALEQALGKLPARQREAFLLRTWEGLDVAETARAMNCSEGSVKTHYSRAVHTLREMLQEHFP
jgi:RNA polymerase sigma-70 factor (ECF subfamily)